MTKSITIDLQLLWDRMDVAALDTLLKESCKSCENRSEDTCEECEYICDNDKNVVYGSHYFNSEDLV